MDAKLLKSSGIYTLSSMLPQIASLFLMPVYTRYLKLSEFGVIALVTSFAALMAPCMGLQLNESFRRFYFDFDQEEARRYFTSVFLFMLGGCIVMSALLLLSAGWWWRWLSGVTLLPLHPYLELGVGLAVLTSLATLGINAMVVEERSRAVFAISVIRTVINVITTVALVVFLGLGARGFLLGQLAALGGALVGGIWLNRHLFVWAAERRMVGEGLRYSLPLIPHALSNALIGYADRFVLGHFVSLREIGLYDFADRIAKVFYRIVFSADRAMTPTYIRLATKGQEVVSFFRDYILRWVVFFALLFVSMALLSKHLLVFLVDETYHAAYVFIPILAGAYVLRGYYLFGIKQLMVVKKTGMLPIITVVSGSINIAANIWLIPKYGVAMAAWTTVLTAGVALLMARYYGQKFFPVDYCERRTWPLVLAALIVACLGAQYHLPNIWLDLCLKTMLIGGIVLALYFFNPYDCRDWVSAWRPLKKKDA